MHANLVKGLHHITALASDPQQNVDFYAGILGLRLVKKTINFDAPDVYHLYYGDQKGSPGTIMTFFPYPGIPRGRKGKGQLTVTSFSAAKSSLDYWMDRFSKFQIKYEKPQQRFDEEFIYFEDYDGLGLELVFNEVDTRQGFDNKNIPLEYSIKGFFGIALSEECVDKTANLLTKQMDHVLVKEKDNRMRFAVKDKTWGFVDLLCNPDALPGLMGAGTIHHVAFATEDVSTQLEARNTLTKNGFNITPVIDREYFHSIYFREPGGVLFEIATIPPGFTVDEDLNHLGQSLKLPPWYEESRKAIEAALLPIHFDLKKFES